MFRKKPTARELARENKREIRRGQRDLDRERNALERQERETAAQIRKLAKEGQDGAVRTLAKQLVRIRKQKERLLTMNATLGSVGLQASTVASQIAVGEAVGKAAAVMGSVNAATSQAKVAETMANFARQSEIMAMQEEMMDDALIDAFDDDGVEAESDQVVGQVLAEIGLDLDSVMAAAPTASLPAQQQQVAAAAAPVFDLPEAPTAELG